MHRVIDIYKIISNEIKSRQNNDRQNYFSDANARRILQLQAMGMQPVRNFWSSPSKLGYNSEDSRKILEYRYYIKKNIEGFPAENFVELLKNYNRTHQAHIRAAVESGTAPPSGSVMYHGGELLSGLTYFLCGGPIATFIFGHASRFFNNPVGEQSKKNRDGLSDILSGSGRVLAQIPNARVRTAGTLSLALAQAMKSTNFAAEIQYKTLKNPDARLLNLSQGFLLSDVKKNTQSFLTQRAISCPGYMNSSLPPVSDKNLQGEIKAVFYLSSDESDDDE